MDRITRIDIKNVRAIEAMSLDISPFTVLIGENGSGKSTIIECLELLRKAADPSFMQQLYSVHRGMPGLLRKGATSIELGVVIEDDEGKEPRLEYSFSLAPEGAGASVDSERLIVGPDDAAPKSWLAISRTRAEAKILDDAQRRSVVFPQHSLGPARLLISAISGVYFDSELRQVFRRTNDACGRVIKFIQGIEVHLGFDTLAAWAAHSAQRVPTLRGTSMLQPAERLTLLGQNLANAWFALRNLGEAHWQQTMELVRLGLGDDVDSILAIPDAGGGHVSLALKRVDLPEPIPAAFLSDGQLSWLAYVAMARLNGSRSLLAIDEPELHLHPALLGRVVSLLTSLENSAPVVLSTHSDRLLSMLDDPASAVRVCSLEGGKAVVRNVDAEELPKWLEEYGDFGKLRESGFLDRVLAEAPAGEGE